MKALIVGSRRTLALRLGALAAILIALVILFPRPGGHQQSRRPTAAGSAITAVQLAVPDFRLTAAKFAGGDEFVLSEHADRPTIIYAMAAWCGSCMPEAQTLVRLKQSFGDRLNLLFVDIDPNDTDNNLAGFAKAAGGPLGVWAVDRAQSVTGPYAIQWLHTMILIRDGRELSRTLAVRSLPQLEAEVIGNAASPN